MEILPYVAFPDSSQGPDTPKLSLEVIGPSRVSITVPFDVSFILRNEEPYSLVIDWEALEAFNKAQFVLLHKKKAGAERCHVQERAINVPSLACPHSEVLPGTGASYTQNFGSEYHRFLEAGETYIFFWPGAEIRSWEHNTKDEHLTKRNCDAGMEDALPIILPASNAIEFTVFEEPEPWPERETWERTRGFWVANQQEKHWRETRNYRARIPVPKVLTQGDRESDAPVLFRQVEGPPVLSKASKYIVTQTTTYEKTGSQDMTPITFYDSTISSPDDSGEVYSVLPESGNWLEALDGDEPCMYGQYADEPEPLFIPDEILDDFVVGDESLEFHTLYPGESISARFELYPDTMCFEPYHVGQKYRYQFNGKVVRWWAWGTLEDHKGTRIRDHDQKPKLVIPTASYEFTVTV